MTDLSLSLTDSMLHWLEQRAAREDYADVGDFLRDLVRREQQAEAEETAWLRVKIEEGEASGISDERPETIIGNIIARRRAKSA
jgi:Arc/MetJ-type ribon-helix-helix transcriptional regulator